MPCKPAAKYEGCQKSIYTLFLPLGGEDCSARLMRCAPKAGQGNVGIHNTIWDCRNHVIEVLAIHDAHDTEDAKCNTLAQQATGWLI